MQKNSSERTYDRLCVCGCGEHLTGKSVGARYRPGHFFRGKKLTTYTVERSVDPSTGVEVVTVSGTKYCYRCDKTRPASDFQPHSSGPYLRYLCRVCTLELGREKYIEAMSQPDSEYRKSQVRSSMYVNHGIRYEDYTRILESQNGGCAICGATKPRPSSPPGRRLSIDHCHTTQEIRGLLCSACNHGIGLFLDRPDLLRAAAVYVETARTGLIHKSRRGSRKKS